MTNTNQLPQIGTQIEATRPVEQPRPVRPAWMTSDVECDWTEDADHENGNYFRKCIPCGAVFVGHKRRYVCRKCYMTNKEAIDAMSNESREEYFARREEELRERARTNDPAQTPPDSGTKNL